MYLHTDCRLSHNYSTVADRWRNEVCRVSCTTLNLRMMTLCVILKHISTQLFSVATGMYWQKRRDEQCHVQLFTENFRYNVPKISVYHSRKNLLSAHMIF